MSKVAGIEARSNYLGMTLWACTLVTIIPGIRVSEQVANVLARGRTGVDEAIVDF